MNNKTDSMRNKQYGISMATDMLLNRYTAEAEFHVAEVYDALVNQIDDKSILGNRPVDNASARVLGIVNRFTNKVHSEAK